MNCKLNWFWFFFLVVESGIYLLYNVQNIDFKLILSMLNRYLVKNSSFESHLNFTPGWNFFTPGWNFLSPSKLKIYTSSMRTYDSVSKDKFSIIMFRKTIEYLGEIRCALNRRQSWSINCRGANRDQVIKSNYSLALPRYRFIIDVQCGTYMKNFYNFKPN